MNKKHKTTKISYASEYYDKHSKQLDKLFGNKRSFMNHVEYDMSGRENYSNKTDAGKALKAYIDAVAIVKAGGDPEIYHAKAAATNVDEVFPDLRKLNKRMNGQRNYSKVGIKISNDPEDGAERTVLSYYEINNSNYVLAEVKKVQDGSPYTVWQYIDRVAEGF